MEKWIEVLRGYIRAEGIREALKKEEASVGAQVRM